MHPPLQQQGSSCGWDSKNGETKVFIVHTEHRKHTEVSQNSNHLPEMLWSLLVALPGGTTAVWGIGASPFVHVCHNILCVLPSEVKWLWSYRQQAGCNILLFQGTSFHHSPGLNRRSVSNMGCPAAVPLHKGQQVVSISFCCNRVQRNPLRNPFYFFCFHY